MSMTRRLFGRKRVSAPTTDPNIADVVLLMHMDDDVLSDVTGKAVTLLGSVVQSEAAGKFGTAADFLSAGSPGIDIPLGTDGDYGSGDVTIEAWINTSVWDRAIVSQRIVGQATAVGLSLFVGTETNNGDEPPTGRLFVSLGFGSLAVEMQSATPIPENTFAHVAYVRSGNNHFMFVNGVKDIITATQAGALNTWSAMEIANSVGARIGCATNGTVDSLNFSGLIDEVRITKGVARYTANFTPSAFPFPDA